MRPWVRDVPVRRRTWFGTALAAGILLALGPPLPSQAQAPLEDHRLIRTGIGLPWLLQADAEMRAAGGNAVGGLTVTPTIQLGLGLPGRGRLGANFTPHSPVIPGEPDEWEVHGRWSVLAEERDDLFGLSVQGGFNGAATSLDAEATISRWLGSLRLSGSGRGFTDARGTGSSQGALAAGAIVFPRPTSLPVSLGVEIVAPLDREPDERLAWSAAVNLGVPYSTHALAIFLTNTSSGTLQGTTWGTSTTRYGFAFSAPIPVGRTLGRVVSREVAMAAVAESVSGSGPAIEASILRHAYPERRIEVAVGQAVAWTNGDDVVHTVSADDGSWDSGAIQPGERWQARFDERGIFPFHCGPHPYMRGVVIVR